MDKTQMERQWRKRGVAQNANLCQWSGGVCRAGEARNPAPSASALIAAFGKTRTKYDA
jgi:hypothetical protein